MLYVLLRNTYRLEKLVAEYQELARVHIAVMDQAYEELTGDVAYWRKVHLEELGYERCPEAIPGLDAELNDWLRQLHNSSRHLAFDLLHLAQHIHLPSSGMGLASRNPFAGSSGWRSPSQPMPNCQRLLEGTKARLCEALLAPEQDIAEMQAFSLWSECERKVYPERTPAHRRFRCTSYGRLPCEEGWRLDEVERLAYSEAARLRAAGVSPDQLTRVMLVYQEARWIRCQYERAHGDVCWRESAKQQTLSPRRAR